MVTPDSCVAYLANGCKPPEAWRIGVEQEFFVYQHHRTTPLPLPYAGERSICALLTNIAHHAQLTKDPGTLVYEDATQEKIVGVDFAASGRSITLEPGCQMEIVQPAVLSMHEVSTDLRHSTRQMLREVHDLDCGLLPLGFAPSWRRNDVSVFPKKRYHFMRNALGSYSEESLEMMFLTCTMQVSIDYGSQEDMVQKLRVSTALQPIATALFANSPLRHGVDSGFQSYRAQTWRRFNPKHAGMWMFISEPDMSFARYADYVRRHAGMYFVYRDGQYFDVYPATFDDFMQHKVWALQGMEPTIEDWAATLSFVFPEVRLRNYLEMRGADSGTIEDCIAHAALWVGAMYDQQALDALDDLVRSIPFDTLQRLYHTIPRDGLRTVCDGVRVQDLAESLVRLASEGLGRRQRLNEQNQDEAIYLAPLVARLQSGTTIADEILAMTNHGARGADLANVYAQYAIGAHDVARR